MKTIQWAWAAGALALIGLSGCYVERDRYHGPYTYEHGDRVDRYGHREVGWCEKHHDSEDCHYEER